MVVQYDLYEYETEVEKPFKAFLDFDYFEMDFYDESYIFYPDFDYLQETTEGSEDNPLVSEIEHQEL